MLSLEAQGIVVVLPATMHFDRGQRPALTANTRQEPEQRPKPACLDQAARTHLGTELRAAYRSMKEAPLPTEQIQLLLALRGKEREHAGRGNFDLLGT